MARIPLKRPWHEDGKKESESGESREKKGRGGEDKRHVSNRSPARDSRQSRDVADHQVRDCGGSDRGKPDHGRKYPSRESHGKQSEHADTKEPRGEREKQREGHSRAVEHASRVSDRAEGGAGYSGREGRGDLREKLNSKRDRESERRGSTSRRRPSRWDDGPGRTENVTTGSVGSGQKNLSCNRSFKMEDDVTGEQLMEAAASVEAAENDAARREGFSIKYRIGDLFSCPGTHSLAHCISEDCHMGKGIAVAFRKQFGGVQDLKKQGAEPGGLAVLERGHRFVYYLVTKKRHYDKPTYKTLEESLLKMRDHCVENAVKDVAMPKIGCGLDNLQWDKVSGILEAVFKDADIGVTVYELEQPVVAPAVKCEGFSLEYKIGDLFSCPGTHSLAHCISEDCRMGKGIAVIFKKRFGGVDELLAQGARAGGLAVLQRNDRFVYYLVTKENYYDKPTYDTLRGSLRDMRDHCVKNGVKDVAMPKIGCGLDKLKWDKVVEILCDVFKGSHVNITVYELEAPPPTRKASGSAQAEQPGRERGGGAGSGGAQGFGRPSRARPQGSSASSGRGHRPQSPPFHQLPGSVQTGQFDQCRGGWAGRGRANRGGWGGLNQNPRGQAGYYMN